MNEFPATLAALKEVAQEETGDCCASDSAYWAVGDALIEECGTDPTWDEDTIKCTFKGGLKLREAVPAVKKVAVSDLGLSRAIGLLWSREREYDLKEFITFAECHCWTL